MELVADRLEKPPKIAGMHFPDTQPEAKTANSDVGIFTEIHTLRVLIFMAYFVMKPPFFEKYDKCIPQYIRRIPKYESSICGYIKCISPKKCGVRFSVAHASWCLCKEKLPKPFPCFELKNVASRVRGGIFRRKVITLHFSFAVASYRSGTDGSLRNKQKKIIMSNISESIPPVTRNLIIINCIVLLLQEVLARTAGVDLTAVMGLHFLLASDFHLYQVVTYMFLHGGLTHLFFNMFALWMFGGIIEQTLGRKRFLVYYFVCGIGAALCQELWQLTQFFYEGMAQYQAVNIGTQIMPMTAFLNSAAWTTVGASGACYGVLLAFGVLYPEQRIMLLIPPIPMKAKYFVFAYAVIELVSAYTSNDNIAHFAHLGGMLFGWFLLRYWRRQGGTGLPLLEKLWGRLRGLFGKKGGPAQFRPAGGGMHGREGDYEYNMEQKRRQERVDQILEKISRSGYDALTAEEKRELFHYSSK